MDNKSIYPIRFISQQTGLSAHVIRAWERRYGAITPQRTATQRRIYSKKDLKRLKLLRDGVAAGNTIAQIAGLDDDMLEELVKERATQPVFANVVPARGNQDTAAKMSPQEFVNAAVDTLKELEPGALEMILDQASVALPRSTLIEQVVLPFAEKVGLLWESGEIKIVHEHFSSLVLRHFLWEMLRSTKTAPNAPIVVGATPVGQWHEFGALVALLFAAESGCRSLYCGSSLPAEEIASAASQKHARAAILSVAQTADCNHLTREIRRLRRILPPDCILIIGGRGAETIRSVTTGADLIIMNDLQVLRLIFQELIFSGNGPEQTRRVYMAPVAESRAPVSG